MGSDTQGALDVPADLANGCGDSSSTICSPVVSRAYQIVAFTPKPRFLDVLLGPAFDVPWVRELLRYGAVGGERNEGR